MRKIKPAFLAVLGVIWPFALAYLFAFLTDLFPVLGEGWALSVLLFLAIVPSAVLLVFSLALRRAKRDAFAKGRVYKYLSPSQICLLCASLLLAVIISLAEAGYARIADMLYIPFMLLSALSVLLFIICAFQRDQLPVIPAPKPAHTSKNLPACTRCGTALPPLKAEQIKQIDGNLYCAACADFLRARKEDRIKSLHTVCCVCGVDHPRSEMIPVDDNFFCQDCFGKKFTGDFFPEE